MVSGLEYLEVLTKYFEELFKDNTRILNELKIVDEDMYKQAIKEQATEDGLDPNVEHKPVKVIVVSNISYDEWAERFEQDDVIDLHEYKNINEVKAYLESGYSVEDYVLSHRNDITLDVTLSEDEEREEAEETAIKNRVAINMANALEDTEELKASISQNEAMVTDIMMEATDENISTYGYIIMDGIDYHDYPLELKVTPSQSVSTFVDTFISEHEDIYDVDELKEVDARMSNDQLQSFFESHLDFFDVDATLTMSDYEWNASLGFRHDKVVDELLEYYDEQEYFDFLRTNHEDEIMSSLNEALKEAGFEKQYSSLSEVESDSIEYNWVIQYTKDAKEFETMLLENDIVPGEYMNGHELGKSGRIYYLVHDMYEPNVKMHVLSDPHDFE